MNKRSTGLLILITGLFLCFSFCQTTDLEEVIGVKKVIEMEGAEGTPFSPAVKFGDLLFLSGSIGMDPETQELPPDVGEQTKNCLERLGAILLKADMDYSDALKCTVYLTDLEDFAEMNEAYTAFFPENPPARACVQVAGLVRGAKVEISMIAGK
jgi:2-iminobutanoate/2-iminopropanoate deaminase